MEGGGSTGVLDYINLLKRNRHYRLLCLSEVGWECTCMQQVLGCQTSCLMLLTHVWRSGHLVLSIDDARISVVHLVPCTIEPFSSY